MSPTSFIIAWLHTVRYTWKWGSSRVGFQIWLESVCPYSMRTWLGAQVLSIFCFSHPEPLIFLSQLSLFLVNFVHLVLSGKQKGGSHLGGVQINELVSHSCRAEWEENPGFRVCQRITLTLFSIVPLTWSKLSIMDLAGEKQGQL